MNEVEYNTPIPGGSDELTDDQVNALADEPIEQDNSELTDDQMNALADEPIYWFGSILKLQYLRCIRRAKFERGIKYAI